MGCEEITKKQGKVLSKLLIPRATGVIDCSQVRGKRNNLGNSGHDTREHFNQLFVVLKLVYLKPTNFCQTFHADVPELRLFEESRYKRLDDGCFKDISQRNPV